MDYPKNPIFKEFLGHKELAIIVDIDGVLAFMDGNRTPFEYNKVINDRCNTFLKELFPMFKNLAPTTIFLVTGRDEASRLVTERWLKKNEVVYDFLFMRNRSDKRCDTEVKGEIYEELIEPDYNILAVFEDRNRLVDMYRLKYNLPTYQVWYGDF